MRITKILLALALIFQNLSDIGYSQTLSPPEHETTLQKTMSAGYQSQNLSFNQQPQTLPTINIPGSGAGYPGVIGIAAGNAKADVTATSRGLFLDYNTGTTGWVGCGFVYNETPADLSALGDLILGLKGTVPGMIKLEIKGVSLADPNKDASDYVFLDDISPDIEQLWGIPLDYFTQHDVDISKVKMINCIVEGNGASGTLEFNRSLTSMWISYLPELGSQDINVPSPGLTNPGIMKLIPDSTANGSVPASGNITATDKGLRLDYTTGTKDNGWVGASFTYDNLTTESTKESFDFQSALNGSPLVFGLKSTFGNIKLELVDDKGNKHSVILDGASSAEKRFWSVSLTEFSNVDLAHVSYVNFIVEGGNKTGTLEIDRLKSPNGLFPDITKSASDINIPTSGLNIPVGVTVSPLGVTTTLTDTDRGISVIYDMSGCATGPWVGAGFSYDIDPDTAALESHDFSGITNLIIGLSCTTGRVKFELVDSDKNTSAIYLDNVSSTSETFYSIDLSKLIGAADLSKISFIYCIVEGDNKAGTLVINKLAVSNGISPDTTKTALDINIPTEGLTVPAGVTVGKDGVVTADLTTTGRGISVDYNSSTEALGAGWVGAGFSYDTNPDTLALESRDLSSLGSLVIGLTCSSPRVKFELVDSDKNTSAIYLDNASSTQETFYSINLLNLVGTADLSKISFIYCVVEGDNKTGTLEINKFKTSIAIPPDGILPSTTYTSADINLPSQGLYYPEAMSVPENGLSSPVDTSVVTPTAYGISFDYNTNMAVGEIGKYTTPTNIGLALTQWLLIADEKLVVSGVSKTDALNMISQYLNSLSVAKKWHGLFYNYDLASGTTNSVISQADNGNLAASLAAVIGAFNDDPAKQIIVGKARSILDAMDWTRLVDTSVNKMYLALNIDSDGNATAQGSGGIPYYVDNVFNETRLGVVFGIVGSNITNATWANLSNYVTDCAIDNGVSLTTLKSGNGEMFQAFLPSIFFREAEWSKDSGSLKGFGVALKNFALIQDYFARTNGLPALLSSATNPYVSGGYNQFGVGSLAVYPAAENVGAPYASALAYLADPVLAMNWLSSLASGTDTPFGFRDAIGANGAMSDRLLILDNAMLVLALQGDTVGTYVENYFNSIGKLQTVKDLYNVYLSGSVLNLTDQAPLTGGTVSEADRRNLQAEHFLAFKDIFDSQTGWVYDHFNIQSGWSGAGFSYNDGVNLNALGPDIIFGIKGDCGKIKFEVTDNNGDKAFVCLEGLTNAAQENIYAIPLSMLQGVNLDNIKAVCFIVEGENIAGTLQIRRTSLPMFISASSALTEDDINIPGSGVDYPGMEELINITTLEATDRGIKAVYSIPAVPVPADQNWAGAGFDYTDSVDLTTYSQLVFGIKGDGDANGRVKFEIKDASGNSRSIYLDGVDPNTQKIWSIPMAYLQGMDLAHVRHIFFIVEGNGRQGTLYVNRAKASQWVPPTTDPAPPEPNLPTTGKSIYGLATPPATALINARARGFDLSYSTGTVGWAGASLSYGSTVNISGFDRLILKMQGSFSRVKFELQDNLGNKFSMYLTGVRDDIEQTWAIQTSLIEGIDLTMIRYMNFIIDDYSLTGNLSVTTD